MKKVSFILILGMLAGLLSACAAGPAKGDMTRSISVTGNGQVYLVPDIAYVYVGTRSEATDVGSALSDNNAQAQAIANALTGMGVDPLDIQTTAFNVYPYQTYDNNGQPAELRYVVENTVFVTVRELTRLGELLDGVVRGGANQINGITFDVQDRKTAEVEARKQAIDAAKTLAQEIADAAGVELGNLISISTSASGGIQPIYDAKGGAIAMDTAASIPVASGQLKISVDAYLTYELK